MPKLNCCRADLVLLDKQIIQMVAFSVTSNVIVKHGVWKPSININSWLLVKRIYVLCMPVGRHGCWVEPLSAACSTRFALISLQV